MQQHRETAPNHVRSPGLFQRTARRLLCTLLAISVIATCVWMVLLDRQVQALDADRAELRHVRYGLLNVDAWKRMIVDILAREIDRIDLTPEVRERLRIAIEASIAAAVAEASRSMAAGINGALPAPLRGVADIELTLRRITGALVSSKAFQSGASTMSERALEILERELDPDRLRAHLHARLTDNADQTFATVDYRRFEAVLARHASADPAAVLAEIDERLGGLHDLQAIGYTALLVALLAIVALVVTGGPRDRPELFALATAASALLACSLVLPMLTIEATIASLEFTLAGNPVSFSGQVLFHESKSILGVAETLLSSARPGPVLVALLLISFSVLLPLAKLIGTFAVISLGSIPTRPSLRFLVFESGKWSMADVIVVAILMAYLGFNGVIDYQLSALGGLHPDVGVVAHNDTALGSGFYVFFGYCLVGILAGVLVRWRLDRKGSTVRAST